MKNWPKISHQIWDDKYRFKNLDGTPVDQTPADTWRRVADALAEAEAPELRNHCRQRFYAALENFRFIPAGRILAGSGTKRRVTLMNCFVNGRIEDDLERIFHHLSEAAQTMQQSGGIGYDFSTLRPQGAELIRTGSHASGPLPFMDTWDAMCRTIMSAGTRRGAMMGVMRCDHPDIVKFITAKRERWTDASGKVRRRFENFNLSVLATNEFMEAVENDIDWTLKFDNKTYEVMNARKLWNLIMQNTYDIADPGVIFIDRINETNPLNYVETIYATNPCGEQPLPPYGCCLLGSINLAMLVKNPFTPGAVLDVRELETLVSTAVRMMDNVLDITGYPLEEQRIEAMQKRRIGLGITGLADALVMCGLRYGTQSAANMTSIWMEAINLMAYTTSIRLAAEKGAFPLLEKNLYLRGPAGKVIESLSTELQRMYSHSGIRNGLLTSIAPTGTISVLAHNVSSGCEPIFAPSYTRKILQPDNTHAVETVKDYALSLWEETQPAKTFPPHWVTTQDLTPAEHVMMQAALQKHVDSAVSKTVNVPEDISFEDFKDVYWLAWKSGCKGITTFRPNDATGSILTADVPVKQVDVSPSDESTPEEPMSDETRRNLEWLKDELEKNLNQHIGKVFIDPNPPARPEQLSGKTYKLKWPNAEHAFYVVINDIEEDGHKRPFEIFVNSKNLESYAWVVALTRMISAVFRRGGGVEFVAEELKQVFDPRGGHWSDGKYVPSLVAAIGDIIQRHMTDNPAPSLYEEPPAQRGSTCPKCNHPSVFNVEGCQKCMNCDWSRC